MNYRSVQVPCVVVIFPMLICASQQPVAAAREREVKQLQSHTFTIPLQKMVGQTLRTADPAVDVIRIGILSALRARGITNPPIEVTVKYTLDLDVGRLVKQMSRLCKDEDATLELSVSVDKLAVKQNKTDKET